MFRALNYAPGIALFLAGVAVTWVVRRRNVSERGAAAGLKRAVAELQAREAAVEERLSRLETVLREYTTKPGEAPTTSQIAAAMEQLLAKTVASLDERLTDQSHAIQVLKTTFSQTDTLLESVLESLDALQGNPDMPESEKQAR